MSGEEKKRLKSVVCAGIVALAIAACAEANLVNSNSIIEDGIEYYIQTDKAVYDLGEEVQMLYRVTNRGDEEVYFEFSTTKQYHFRVTLIDGTHIWQMDTAAEDAITYFTLKPDESKEFNEIWGQVNDNGTRGGTDDYPVEPGNYQVIGEFYIPITDHYVPVSVSIQIIPEPAMIYYVDADASGANDGLSWADAYNYLQDALAEANSIDMPVEIWVAQGIYKPDQGVNQTPGNWTATFRLINGVTIKGGYAGFGEPDPNARDMDKYETTLSGDLYGDDIDVNDPCDLWNEPSRAENSYHVVTGNGTDETAIIDGFIITGGHSYYIPDSPGCQSGGAGMYNKSGSPMVLNCVFASNSHVEYGGGMHNYHDSSPTLINCSFNGNSASVGGGISNANNSNPKIINCTFSGNLAESSGGGICNVINSNPMLINCTFSGNSARAGGGMINVKSNPTLVNCKFVTNWRCGIYNDESTPSLTNCIFISNSSSRAGGGMCNSGSSPTLTNCTFAENSAPKGSAVACDSYLQQYPSSIRITNCILWDGGNEIWNGDNSAITITYSAVKGGWPDEGNIDADPCFVERGYWDANGVWVDGDYHLLPDSPCIDAGDPNYIAEPNETDLDGMPRIIGGRIDMGAYEYSPPVPAEVRIVPRTINLQSKGNWINCYIWLPGDCDVAAIDPNSVLLEDEIQAELLRVDEQQQVARVRFSRSEVQGILNVGQVELTITGQLTDGTRFEGTDVIRVIDKGDKK